MNAIATTEKEEKQVLKVVQANIDQKPVSCLLYKGKIIGSVSQNPKKAFQIDADIFGRHIFSAGFLAGTEAVEGQMNSFDSLKTVVEFFRDQLCLFAHRLHEDLV